MSLAQRIPYARDSDVRYVNQFDYLDRVIVFTYMTFAILAVIFIIQENTSPAEQAELNEPILFGGGVFDILGWILLLFLAWPLIRLILVWLARAAYDGSQRGYRRLREVT